jgi:zinc transport system permease protein
MIGHGLAHVAFAGVALGLLLRTMPLLVALAIAIIASLGISNLKERAGLHGDTAIAIISSVGMALGILGATLAKSYSVDLFSYLFGDILAIEPLEVWLSLALAAAVVLLVIGNYHALMFLTFDRESAKVSGIPIRRFDTLLSVLTAVTVVLGMKVVGLLLVSALVVIPAAAALQVARSFKQAILLSSAVALSSVLLGLLSAVYLDIPASGAIVIISFLSFTLLFFCGKRR